MSERTDRELLELAAKAAEYKMTPERLQGDYWLKDGRVWNPLTDDGDALRLAVRLELHLILLGFADVVNGADEVTIVSHKWAEAVVHHDTDRYAATRRAIVLAAAEIGAKP